jgi:Xaa-Pro dipeptidase
MAPPDAQAERVVAATAIARDAGVGAIVVTEDAGVRWLTGEAGPGVIVCAGELRPLADLPGLDRGEPIGVDAPDTALRRALQRARARKDALELESIRDSAALATAGQRAVRDALAPGLREIDAWSAAVTAMQALAGGPVEAGMDLMFGARTESIGEPPGRTSLVPGDLTLVDIAPRHDGWWADSCATICTGTPSAEQRRIHDAARRALDRGIAAVRPGLGAGELDAIVRGSLAEAGCEYPHHTGHGVGLAPQEEPWIVPGADVVLEPGMVVALEPGTYGSGFGVRVEHLMLVREDGAEVLTEHSLDFI